MAAVAVVVGAGTGGFRGADYLPRAVQRVVRQMLRPVVMWKAGGMACGGKG